MDIIRQFVLQLHTFFPTMDATDDFEIALIRLMERWDWTIAAYRSYLTLSADNNYTIICTLVFLTIAQGMRLLYGQLSAGQLQTLVDVVGPRTFVVVAAMPSIGVIIIPIMQILWISRSPITAVCLTLVIVVPVVLLPLAMFYFAKARMRRPDAGQA
ncbi:hypothetical protein EDC04DRAFT_1700839 [Pisolithus marmoratus]|nr:hypothetical protein EDC04DRAFT_1700839 [Pisolithus marmoratus]